jgi:two-component system chemotaxis response regulator CheY
MRIMVIDDDEDQRELAATILRWRFAGAVIEAADGMDGLERALAEPPDLVICDVNMPRMDGPTLVGQMRRHRTLAHAAVILCSGESALPRLARALGVAGWVAKPFTADELAAEVERVLGYRGEGTKSPRGRPASWMVRTGTHA